MKRILLSVLTISMVGAVTIGATGAYFSDTEKSTGNTFTAGTIDLALNTLNPYPGTALLTLSDIKPSQTLTPLTLTLKNVGNNEGKLTINFSIVGEKDKLIGGVDADTVASFEFASMNYDATNNPEAIDMSVNEFASLVYVQAATEDGVNVLSDLVAGYDTAGGNGDGKVSLYELASKDMVWSGATAPYDIYLQPTKSTVLVVTLHLGDSLDPFTTVGHILTAVPDNRPQADGIELAVTATLRQVP